MAQYQAELQLLQQIQQLYEQDQARRVAQQRAAYQALAQQLQPIAGQIQDIVAKQTGAQTGFASGFSDALKQIANQSAGSASADVAGFGMPGEIAPHGQEMADVTFGLHGYIPATGFSNFGAAQAAAAAMLPATALRQGEADISRSMSQFQSENLLPLQVERLRLAASLPQRRAEYAETQSRTRSAKRQEAIDLYNAGFLSQRELARQLGVRRWKRFPDILKGEGPAELDIREVGGDLVSINPRTGKVQVVYQGPQETNYHYFQKSDGSDWRINEDTGHMEQIGGPEATPPVRTGSPTTGYDFWDGQTGAHLGHMPATAPSSSGTKVTPKVRATARRLAKEAFYGTTKTYSDPLTGEERKVREDRLGYEGAFDLLVSKGIPPMLAWQTLKRYYPKAPRPKASPAASGGTYTGPTDMSSTSRQQRKLYAQQIGQQLAGGFGWGSGSEWDALVRLWTNESGWDWLIPNYQGSGAYGIPQALPASKMSSAGADWKTNPATQIRWGLNYIKQRYGSPSRALAFWMRQNPHWY
jgi:hypothetical protein